MNDHKFNIHLHWVEIIIATISALIFVATAWALSSSPETALLAGIIPISLAMSVALIKSFIVSKTRDTGKITILAPDQFTSISERFIEMSDHRLFYAHRALDQFKEDLKKVSEGCVPLSEGQYFKEIMADMQHCIDYGGKVYAVNCIDEIRLSDDKKQVAYMTANYAAAKANVTIERVIAVRPDILENPLYAGAIQEIGKQINTENINIYIVDRSTLADEPMKKDWVMFSPQKEVDIKSHIHSKNYTRVYLAEPDTEDLGRVARAELLFDVDENQHIKGYKDIFNTLKKRSKLDESIREKIVKKTTSP